MVDHSYFQASRPRFVFWVVLSAIIYIGAIFVFFHVAMAVAGEAAQFWLPVVAICLLLGYLFLNWLRKRGGEEIDQPT